MRAGADTIANDARDPNVRIDVLQTKCAGRTGLRRRPTIEQDDDLGIERLGNIGGGVFPFIIAVVHAHSLEEQDVGIGADRVRSNARSVPSQRRTERLRDERPSRTDSGSSDHDVHDLARREIDEERAPGQRIAGDSGIAFVAKVKGAQRKQCAPTHAQPHVRIDARERQRAGGIA